MVKNTYLKLYNHQVHRVSTSTTIHLASVASALGSSALVLPFSAGLAFFVLGALFATAFFLASTAAGFGFYKTRKKIFKSVWDNRIEILEILGNKSLLQVNKLLDHGLLPHVTLGKSVREPLIYS